MALGLTSVKITLNSCHCGMVLTTLQLPENAWFWASLEIINLSWRVQNLLFGMEIIYWLLP